MDSTHFGLSHSAPAFPAFSTSSSTSENGSNPPFVQNNPHPTGRNLVYDMPPPAQTHRPCPMCASATAGGGHRSFSTTLPMPALNDMRSTEDPFAMSPTLTNSEDESHSYTAPPPLSSVSNSPETSLPVLTSNFASHPQPLNNMLGSTHALTAAPFVCASEMSHHKRFEDTSFRGGLDTISHRQHAAIPSSSSLVGTCVSSTFSPSSAAVNGSSIHLADHKQFRSFCHSGRISNDAPANFHFSQFPLCSCLDSCVSQRAFAIDDARSPQQDRTATDCNDAEVLDDEVDERHSSPVLLQHRSLAPKLSSPPHSSFEPRVFEHEAKLDQIQGDNSSSKNVVAIPKAPYSRPSYPKKTCPHCSDHPEGFRGEHELRRHIERAHATTKKIWVCVDRSTSGKFLANCKACRNRKTYNAYYNAAAHLRRAHFNPRKPRGRGKGRIDEKRGGKGGGDRPAMDVLKGYMEEIEVIVIA